MDVQGHPRSFWYQSKATDCHIAAVRDTLVFYTNISEGLAARLRYGVVFLMVTSLQIFWSV